MMYSSIGFHGRYSRLCPMFFLLSLAACASSEATAKPKSINSASTTSDLSDLSAPHEVFVEAITSSSVTLSWKAPPPPLDPKVKLSTYSLVFTPVSSYDIDLEREFSLAPNTTSKQVTGLQEGSRYVVLLSAVYGDLSQRLSRDRLRRVAAPKFTISIPAIPVMQQDMAIAENGLPVNETGAGAVIHSHSKAAVLATLIFSGPEFQITHQEMIKGIFKGSTGVRYRYDEKMVVPIIENTPFEKDLKDRMTEVIQEYPETSAVLVRRHGVYVWGDTWEKAKTMSECYDYLFDIAVKMKQLGLDPSEKPPKETNFMNSLEQRTAAISSISDVIRDIQTSVAGHKNIENICNIGHFEKGKPTLTEAVQVATSSSGEERLATQSISSSMKTVPDSNATVTTTVPVTLETSISSI